MAARDFLALAQYAFAGRHVVVVGFGGRRQRRVREANAARIELVARCEAKSVGFFLESDRVLFGEIENVAIDDDARGDRRDDDARQAVLAFEARHEILIDADVEDQAAGFVRNDLAPVRLVGRMDRRHDDAEILRVGGIGGDDQQRPVMLDAVLMADAAGCDEAGRRIRAVGIDQMNFARLVIVNVDQDELARLRRGQADEEARVLFGVDELIVGYGRSEFVAVNKQRALMIVDFDIEQS